MRIKKNINSVWDHYKLILYQILQTNITRTVLMSDFPIHNPQKAKKGQKNLLTYEKA